MNETKNVLVIGSGGREHAICWKLAQSSLVKNIYCSPGSFGISQTQKVINVSDFNIKDFEGVAKWCKCNAINLVVVGPEDPLANGIADILNSHGILCFGPEKAGAQIESDKSWAKDFMIKYEIPTARYQSFINPTAAKEFIMSASYSALVVKAAGLAAGKGVVVAENKTEACVAVDEMLVDKKFGESSSTIVVEELLEGEEVSVLAFTDGDTVSAMLPAQDHKRIGDGDVGPNTGGMGAYCPCPLITNEQLQYVVENVLMKAIRGLKNEGISYKGVLYAGMMLTSDGPKTLEFNCRFGDPETQVILPLLNSDLYSIMEACCTKKLASENISWKTNVSNVGVVMASKGYPETATKGCSISGISLVSGLPDHFVFHSGTSKSSNGALVTAGGRVLLVSVCAPSIRTAASLATSACKQITFLGAQFRKDIAHKAFTKCGGLSYLDSGVDIEAGAALMRAIEPVARSSHRSGVLGRLGCFGGLYSLARETYVNEKGEKMTFKDPVLVQGADGVGTKLKIAMLLNKFDTVGIDLVAMCVNDVLCAGAEPFAFLDYIACGKLDVNVAVTIVEGIANACKLSGCALLGGETAEMPSMYDIGKYDLAGFAVGVVENELQLPMIDKIKAGDIVIGLPSSGLHSNGFSLVQKVFEKTTYKYSDVAPFSQENKTFGEEFLTPTRLYIKPLLSAIRNGYIKGLAHITGGGLIENIPRILPPNVKVCLDAKKFKINPIFGWLKVTGHIPDDEMLRTYNCGVGMIGIVSPEDVQKVLNLITGVEANVIGSVDVLSKGSQRVEVNNFNSVISSLGESYVKNVPVLPRTMSYKDSGVNIEAGDSLVNLIKPLARSTTREGVIGGLGGFGGLFRINSIKKDYHDPVLVMATDGVGTKLKIAQDISRHNTVGIDLVAMCVNDILCNGAEPLTFLDYYACGSLDVKVAHNILLGIANGCRQANCALLGGETAEMPGMYKNGIYDVAGFALGVVEKSQILPKLTEINVGDAIIGLPSNGIHSNGFSLIHKLIEMHNFKMSDPAPFSDDGLTFGEELLKPAKIYVQSVLPAIRSKKIKAIAHVTEGGLVGSIPKIFPGNLRARLNANYWNIHPVFAWIADMGNVSNSEMMNTFNCGLGMVLIVSPENQAEVMNIMRSAGAMVVGSIQARPPGSPKVVVDNFSSTLEYVRRLPILPRKRVAVLISGSGTNLQALIDSTRDSSQGICADVALVISNRSNAYGLERAKNSGIPSEVILKSTFKDNEEFENAIMKKLETAKIDIVCLAGFMKILSPKFVRKWRGHLINIHPSLLPKYPGLNAQQQAFDAKDTETGCTVHFVDEGVDTGAILVQERVAILENDTLEMLTERIHHAEHRAFPRALKLLASGRVRLGADSQLVHVY